MRNFGITNCAPWASAPPVGAAGDTYWNTTNKILYVSDGTAWVPWPSGGASFPPGGDVYQVLVNAGTGVAWGWAEGSIRRIDQNGHGFSVGQLLKLTATGYALAQANSVANAEVVGAVYSVINANAFVISLHGRIGSGFSGLTPGQVLYLSPTTPGGYTAVEPSTAGQISKPVFIAEGSGSVYFFNLRGNIIPDPKTDPTWNTGWGIPAGGQYVTKSLSVQTTANVDLGIEINFQAVANRFYEVTFGCVMGSTVARDRVQLRAMLGAAGIVACTKYSEANAITLERAQLFSCPTDFPAGLTNLKLNGWRLAGTGTITFSAGTTDPAFLCIKDIGPTG